MDKNPILLSEYRGLENQLKDNLCEPDGREWLEALKNFMKKQPTWVTEATANDTSNTFTTPAMNCATTDVFDERKECHKDSFKDLLESVPRLNTQAFEVKEYVLSEDQNGEKISQSCGGDDALVHKSKAHALATLAWAKFQEKYENFMAVVAFYKEENGVLCSAFCDWRNGKFWTCYSVSDLALPLYAGHVVLLPVT